MSQSQISKFETGKKTPKLVDVERTLKALDVPQELVSEVTALARVANSEWQDSRSLWRRASGPRFAHHIVICCPNLQWPRIRCPLGLGA
ncbi:helix-turn-helix domain-containing protein [Streptomyces sp. P1-3]|uniref:helix-turn-helix domain-containing protein n=1 Tax=Streptomyces sp. P1-3 TaxID=3421658 RepID=UPI003D36B19A